MAILANLSGARVIFEPQAIGPAGKGVNVLTIGSRKTGPITMTSASPATGMPVASAHQPVDAFYRSAQTAVQPLPG